MGLLKMTAFALVIILAGPVYFGLTMQARGVQMRSNAVNLEITRREALDYELARDSALREMVVDTFGFVAPTMVEEAECDSGDRKITIVPGEVSQNIVERYEAAAPKAEELHPLYVMPFAYAYLNIEDPVFARLPSILSYIYAVGTSYVSHGYHGLAIALRIPFESTFGVGQVMIAHETVSSLLGIDIYARSYTGKVNNSGFPLSLHWGTAFIQFASDFSFPGASLFMGVLGIMFALFWMEALHGNILSQLLFVVMTINLLFITSWWQAGLSVGDFILSYGSAALWLIMKVYAIIQIRRSIIKKIAEL